LFQQYDDPDKNVASSRLLLTLHELIIAASDDEDLVNITEMGSFSGDGTLNLKDVLHNVIRENMIRVIQFIIGKSKPVKELRAAIDGCSNPHARHIK